MPKITERFEEWWNGEAKPPEGLFTAKQIEGYKMVAAGAYGAGYRHAELDHGKD